MSSKEERAPLPGATPVLCGPNIRILVETCTHLRHRTLRQGIKVETELARRGTTMSDVSPRTWPEQRAPHSYQANGHQSRSHNPLYNAEGKLHRVRLRITTAQITIIARCAQGPSGNSYRNPLGWNQRLMS